MIDIKMDFDSKKFERDLKKGIERAALKEANKKLRDLTKKGLRVAVSKGTIVLNGDDDLVAEAVKRLS